MDIYIYVCYWRDLTLLRYCITPVIPYATKIIVHDGRFAEFPDTGVRSDDGIEEWCENYSNVDYHPSCCEYETQMDKRNIMWNLVPLNKWILIVDADVSVVQPQSLNTLKIPEGKLYGNVTVYSLIRLKDPLKEPKYHQEDHGRLIYNDGRFEYGRNHYEILRDGERYHPDFHSGLAYMHYYAHRDVNRIAMKMDYYRKRKETHVRMWLVKEDTIEEKISHELEKDP